MYLVIVYVLNQICIVIARGKPILTEISPLSTSSDILLLEMKNSPTPVQTGLPRATDDNQNTENV